MLYRLFVIGLLGLMLATTATLAQTESEENMLADLIETQDIDLDFVALQVVNGQFHLTVSGILRDGCQFPLLVRETTTEEAIFIELYRDVPPDAACTRALLPFEETFVLATPVADGFFLAINEDYTARIHVPQIAPINPPTVLDAMLSPYERQALSITTMSLTGAEATHHLLVEGERGGCEGPLLFQPFMVQGELVYRAYVPVEPNTPCPAIARTFSVTFDTGIPSDTSMQFTVGEFTSGYDEELGYTVRSYHIIEQAQPLILESFPPQLRLEVSGYQADGCELPIKVWQWRQGRMVTVRISRDVPITALCPMMIVSYDETIDLGSFTPGAIRIDVNGIILNIDL